MRVPESHDLREISAMDTTVIRKVLCFICQEEVDAEMVVMVNSHREDMICMCKKHLRPDYEVEYEQGTLVR
jgi:hypothetical protein